MKWQLHPYETFLTGIPRQTRVARRLFLAERIMAYYQIVQGAPRHFTDIAYRLNHPRPQTVLNACINLAHAGVLERYQPGVYQLRQEEVRDG